MKVREVMRRAPAVGPDATVAEAAERMRDRGVGALVVREGGVVLGIVTDRDITVRATARGHDPRVAHVRDAMTRSVVTCRPDDEVDDAAGAMAEHRVRRLVVLDAGKELVGIVSLDDLAAGVDGCLAGEVLEGVALPPDRARG